MGVKELKENLHARYVEVCKKTERLRRVPQRAISPFEVAVYFALPMLLVACGAMPSTAIFLLPLVLPLLYVLYRRFGSVFPLACITSYGVLSLTLNYDILSIVYTCFLLVAFVGVVASVQVKSWMLSVAVATVVATCGAALGVGVVRLVENKSVGDIAAEYVIAEFDDPYIFYLAEAYYEDYNVTEAGDEKFDKSDERYLDDVKKRCVEYVSEEFLDYIGYYCVHYGAVLGAVGYFVATMLNRRTASIYDLNATEETIKLSTRCLGGVEGTTIPLAKMRLPRTYLLVMLLPGFVASLIVDIVGGYEALSATLMHAFVTVPTAISFVGLGAYLCELFVGRAKTIAYVVLGLVTVAMVYIPLVAFVCSIMGLCDISLNLEFWIEYLKD